MRSLTLWTLLLIGAGAAGGARGQTETKPTQPAEAAITIAADVDREISGVEKQVLEAAEAMPESKFDFSPESLNISGSEYKGVRSFAQQVKHVAASNYAIWAAVKG